MPLSPLSHEKYEILQAESCSRLEGMVNEALSKGGRLWGQPFTKGFHVCQVVLTSSAYVTIPTEEV